MDLNRRLTTLRALQRLLDSAFRVPGTRIRFGWDPIVGLVPGAGDALSTLLSCALIVQAHQMGLPRVVQLRMLLNIAVDIGVGIVPVVGDVADVFWQSNARNMTLLERHAARPQPVGVGDWVFVVSVLVAAAAVAAVPVVVMYWMWRLLNQAIAG